MGVRTAHRALAARFMLDEEHPDLSQDLNDTNLYTLGRICEHSVTRVERIEVFYFGGVL